MLYVFLAKFANHRDCSNRVYVCLLNWLSAIVTAGHMNYNKYALRDRLTTLITNQNLVHPIALFRVAMCALLEVL